MVMVYDAQCDGCRRTTVGELGDDGDIKHPVECGRCAGQVPKRPFLSVPAWAHEVPMPDPPDGQALEVTRANRGMMPLPEARLISRWWSRIPFVSRLSRWIWLSFWRLPIRVPCDGCDQLIPDREIEKHRRICRWLLEMKAELECQKADVMLQSIAACRHDTSKAVSNCPRSRTSWPAPRNACSICPHNELRWTVMDHFERGADPKVCAAGGRCSLCDGPIRMPLPGPGMPVSR